MSDSSSSASNSVDEEDSNDETSDSEDTGNDNLDNQDSLPTNLPGKEKHNWQQSSESNSSDDDGKSNSGNNIENISKNKDLPEKSGKKDLRLFWESNPQIYGVRRSSRQRKEPERLTAIEYDDYSDSGHRKKKGRSRHHESTDFTATLTESESEDASTSEFGSSPDYMLGQRRHKKQRKGQASSTGVKRGPSRIARMRAKLEGKNMRRGGKYRSGKNMKGESTTLSEATSSEEDDAVPQRSSSRTQNTKISYKEESPDETDSDDVVEVQEKEIENENAECIDRVMDIRIGRVGATGASTTFYAESDPNANFDPSMEEKETHYLISWKGRSHIHNTWESEKSLQDLNVRGMKKLENYIRKKEELNAWLSIASPEDAEYYHCQQELNRNLTSTYCQAELVIAKVSNASGSSEYQVKWEGLPYSASTWEYSSLISRLFPKKIEEFDIRQNNTNVPTKDSKIQHGAKFVPMIGMPPWHKDLASGLCLRDYQLDGVNWLAHSWCRHNSVILADEMGLGKTIQSITFLSYLYHTHMVYGPFLIIVPLSTVASWQKEFQTWAPYMNTIVFVGDAVSRSVIRDVEWTFPNKKLKFNAVVTTYEILLKEKEFLGSHTWAVIAVDEAHRLKNEDSLLYRSLKEFKSHHRMLITGTPLQNTLKELWSLLHFIMPEKFSSWDEFEDQHGLGRESGYASLHLVLQPFLLRRVKKDVEKSLPAKVERILRVEMSSLQKQYYRWILTKNYQALSKGLKGKVSSLCNIVMELKKCCNHAYLTKADDREVSTTQERLKLLIKSSGKMILLDKLLVRLREDGHRVLIFSQMVRMLDLLQEYLIMNKLPFQRLDGSIKGETRRRALDHFNSPGSEDFCFLLSTRAGGLGINLASADTVIIFDSDWNPQNDLQAQARAHRIGQKNQVNIYRLVCAGSVEEEIIERAKKKMVLDHLVIQRMDTSGKTVLSSNAPSSSTGNPFNKDELGAILKFGAEELFKETEGDENEPECDIDEILRRAETTEEQVETGPGNELLSAFKFATFMIDTADDDTEHNLSNGNKEDPDRKDWVDIIPEASRKEIEEEERKKQAAELYLPPRNRKSFKIHTGGSESEAGSEYSDDEGSEDDDGNEADAVAPKRRSKLRQSQENDIPGFSSTEVRKFLKSFRKFGNPLERLDAIARDAELTVQSEADLRRLGVLLNENLHEAMGNYNKTLQQNANREVPQQNRRRGPSFRIGGASVSVKTTTACIEELLPLVEVMPREAEARKIFRLGIPVKPMRNCDCEWTSDDDSRLLIGIYEYGMGSWEQVQSDISLGLMKKILRPNNEKPQAKQLQSRVEYLMKLLKKTKELGRAPTAASVSASSAAVNAAASNVARKMRLKKSGESGKNNDTSQTKRKNRKIKSKANIQSMYNSDVDDNNTAGTISKTEGKPKSKTSQKKTSDGSKGKNDDKGSVKLQKNDQSKSKMRKMKKKHKNKTKENETVMNEDRSHAPDKKKVNNKLSSKQRGPVHITTSDPVLIGLEDDFSGELDRETFRECKERMRPVKKALKMLDKPPETATDEKAQYEHMKHCLLKIGHHVDQCLMKFQDLETRKKWRRNLWIFISKFTEFNPQRLHKLYKRAAAKKRESELEESVKPIAGVKRNHSPVHANQNKGARHSQNTAPKRVYEPPDSRHWERTRSQHHRPDVYCDRYSSQDLPHDNHATDHGWHKHAYREHGRINDYPRPREYEDSRNSPPPDKYIHEAQYNVRGSRMYHGPHRRSPHQDYYRTRPSELDPHEWDRYGRYSPSSGGMGSHRSRQYHVRSPSPGRYHQHRNPDDDCRPPYHPVLDSRFPNKFVHRDKT